MTQDYFISNITCEFTSGPNGDMSLTEFMHFLNQHYKGIRAEADYVINTNPTKTGYYVTGIGRLGAQAVASVAAGHSLKVNRLDIRYEFVADNSTTGGAYFEATHRLNNWYKKFKPLTTTDSQLQTGGVNHQLGLRSIYGTRTAPMQTFVFDMVQNFSGLAIEFRCRADWAKNVWTMFEDCSGEEEYIIIAKEAFAAIQNTFYGPDFFELGLDKHSRVTRTKKRAMERDYWTWVNGVSQRIYRECKKQSSAHLAEESMDRIREQVIKLLQSA